MNSFNPLASFSCAIVTSYLVFNLEIFLTLTKYYTLMGVTLSKKHEVQDHQFFSCVNAVLVSFEDV